MTKGLSISINNFMNSKLGPSTFEELWTNFIGGLVAKLFICARDIA